MNNVDWLLIWYPKMSFREGGRERLGQRAGARVDRTTLAVNTLLWKKKIKFLSVNTYQKNKGRLNWSFGRDRATLNVLWASVGEVAFFALEFSFFVTEPYNTSVPDTSAVLLILSDECWRVVLPISLLPRKEFHSACHCFFKKSIAWTSPWLIQGCSKKTV